MSSSNNGSPKPRVWAETIKLVAAQKPNGGGTAYVYPINHLLTLRNAGAKIAPASSNSYAYNFENLFTQEDYAQFPDAIGGPIKLLYLNPEVWTEEKLKKEHWRFEGVRVVPGKTYIYNNGKKFGPYRLYILDTDSFKAYEKIKDLLENDFCLNTYVTESYKITDDGIPFGFHIYWLEDWKEDDDCVNIEPNDCIAGGEFEIMIGTKATQIAGHHREHTDFYYHNVGCRDLKEIKFMIRNGLYNQLMDKLHGLLLNPNEIEKRRKIQKRDKDIFHRGREKRNNNYGDDSEARNVEIHSLTTFQIQTATIWASPFYGAESADSAKHYYHFSQAFIAVLIRQNADRKSIVAIMDTLYDLKPSPKYPKGTWHNWIDSCINEWKNGGHLFGIPSLAKEIRKNSEYAEEELAFNHIRELLEILNLGSKDNKNESGYNFGPPTKEKIRDIRLKQHQRELLLAKERLSDSDIDFAFNCCIKEAPIDKISISQLIHGCLSAFTNRPISHILSSLLPGAGKNYLIRIAVGYIPHQYVNLYNRQSDKALYHMSGEMVISQFDPITGKEIVEPAEAHLDNLSQQLKILQRIARRKKTQNDMDQIDNIKEEIRNTLAIAQNLISLDNMVQVFLDTPQEGLWDAYMSLLSQDAERDQLYTFTDKQQQHGFNSSLGIRVTRLRGAPTIISAGVIDDTKTERFGEKNRRLIHVNPDTSAKKIKIAMQMNNDQQLGLPEEYSEKYLSKEDKERSKHIFEVLIAKLKLHKENFGYKDSGVYLPETIRRAIEDSIDVKEDDVWSMTINDRLSRYLSVIGLEHMDNRLRIVNSKTGESRVLLTFDDLHRSLDFLDRSSSQVRPYISKFYNETFLKVYAIHTRANTGTRSGKTIEESERGTTSRQISAFLKEQKNKTTSPSTITERYLNPLFNQGILNKLPSELDKRSYIYFPIEGFEKGISSIFDDDKELRLTLKHPEKYPRLEKVEQELLRQIEPKNTFSPHYILVHPNGDVHVHAGVQNYLGKPEKCFKNVDFGSTIKPTLCKKNGSVSWIFDPLSFKKETVETENSVENVKNPNVASDRGNDCTTVSEQNNQFYDLNEFGIFSGLENESTIKLTTLITSLQHKENVDPNSKVLWNWPDFERHAGIDCEWYRDDLQSNIDAGLAGKIYCVCFMDRDGTETKLHQSNFSNREDFMVAILETIQKYDALIGYCINQRKNEHKKDSIDGDIAQLRKNFNELGTEATETFEDTISRVQWLDLFPVFTCAYTKGTLSTAGNMRLRGNSLSAISEMYLGEGKLDDLTGPEIENLDPEIQMKYCLQDAKLALKLAQKDNYKLLNVFYNISKEARLDFYNTCNYASMTSWWRGMLKKWAYKKADTELIRWQDRQLQRYESGNIKSGVKFRGGEVLSPSAVGMHLNVTCWDVASMYPTMSIVHNISPETINCDCCKDDPEAKIDQKIMVYINEGLAEKDKLDPGLGWAPRPFHYWICRKQEGILKQIMKDLFKKKSEFKKQGLRLEEKAVKILANSGYGVFGEVNFEHYNVGVTELITAFARYSLLGIKREIEALGSTVVYGDTDSLFIANDNNRNPNNGTKIMDIAKSKFGVEFSKDKTFKIFITLSTARGESNPSRKQYFGLLEDGKVYSTVLIGLKSNYPKYFHDVIEKLVSREIIEEFLDSQDLRERSTNKDQSSQIAATLKEAFRTLDKMIDERQLENLARTEDNGKPLNQFSNNGWQIQIFKEILEDFNGDLTLAEMKSQAHKIHPHWKIVDSIIDGKKKSWTIHPEKYVLDRLDYKEMLWKRVKPILDAFLFSKEECDRLKSAIM